MDLERREADGLEGQIRHGDGGRELSELLRMLHLRGFAFTSYILCNTLRDNLLKKKSR